MKVTRNGQGFTLLETAVAMAIMFGGVTFLASSWSGNLMRIEKTRINSTMGLLLQAKMTEMELRFAGQPIEQIPESAEGNFGDKYPGWTWTMASKKFEMPDLSGALTSRSGGADEMTLLVVKTAQDFINESVRELVVEVTFENKAKRKVSNKVSRLFVDYSKEPTVPGLPGGTSPGGGGG